MCFKLFSITHKGQCRGMIYPITLTPSDLKWLFVDRVGRILFFVIYSFHMLNTLVD